MKSLVLKDIFNIWHNVKTLGFVLIFLIVTLIPQGGSESYIIFVSILCSAMIITTFTFDEQSAWVKYAMIMPVSKKDYVAGKFLTLFLFCGAGLAAGLIFGVIGGLIIRNFITLPPVTARSLLLTAFTGLLMAIVIGSASILLLFRFGATKARIMSLIAVVVPFAAAFGIFKVFQMGGVDLERHTRTLLCLAPVAALLWSYGMYRASYRVFLKKELLH